MKSYLFWMFCVWLFCTNIDIKNRNVWEWIYCEQYMSMFYNDVTFDYLMHPTLVPAAENLFSHSLLTPYVERYSDHTIHVDTVCTVVLCFGVCFFVRVICVCINFATNFLQKMSHFANILSRIWWLLKLFFHFFWWFVCYIDKDC